MTEEPVFNVKRVGGDYVVWISHLGVLATASDLNAAMNTAQAEAVRVIESFDRAGVSAPVPAGGGDNALPISSLVKANMVSFALKSVLVSALLVVLMLIGSRMLPMRGLSDFADYARLAPEERVNGMIGAAKDIGKISRPVLNELGLGCSRACKE